MTTRPDPTATAGVAAGDLRPVVVAAERFAGAVEARAIALMLRLDVTMAQLRALTTIRRLGRANGRQLSAALGLTPGAIVAICDQLEERGYVRRVADAEDRRITWLVLSDRGTGAFKATPAASVAKSATKALLADFTDEEREGFVKIANAFADALESAVAVDGDRTATGPDR